MRCIHDWQEAHGFARWFCAMSKSWTIRRAVVQKCRKCETKRMKRYGIESMWDDGDYKGMFPPEQDINKL